MLLDDDILESYPKEAVLKDGVSCQLRPLLQSDEKAFHDFFLAIPEPERMFIKHRVEDPEVIREWCEKIDYGRNFPMLALIGEQVIGCATLHQQLGGWKRHIGRVSALVHPEFRARGLARAMVEDVLDVARHCGLQRVEAEFLSEQERAIKVFGLFGFRSLVHLPGYVKDMQANTHDYVLMGMNLKTDEEYAGMG